MKAKLPDHFYKHFMLLFVAVYCLASPIFCQPYCDYAKQLICLFVSQVGVLYGETQYVCNIHGVLYGETQYVCNIHGVLYGETQYACNIHGVLYGETQYVYNIHGVLYGETQYVCNIHSVLYGETQYVYNIHALVHHADDVSRFGALDIFSSFAFESFLGKQKRLVRKPNFPLQQIIRRLLEDCFKDTQCTNESESGCGIVKTEHHNGHLPRADATYLQFEQLCLPKSFFLLLKQGNNCILARGKVVIIRNILSPSENSHERILIVENFRSLNNFHTEPVPSSDLRIFQVGHLSGDIVAVKMNEVSCKCVLLPYRNSFVSVPLIPSFVLQ